jgi:microcystin-dependent protein
MPLKIWRPSIIKSNGLILCNGAQLNANEYPELFSILGHTYGGYEGKFILPDMQAAPGNYDFPLIRSYISSIGQITMHLDT